MNVDWCCAVFIIAQDRKSIDFIFEYLSEKVDLHGQNCPLKSIVNSMLLNIELVQFPKTLRTVLIVKKKYLGEIFDEIKFSLIIVCMLIKFKD